MRRRAQVAMLSRAGDVASALKTRPAPRQSFAGLDPKVILPIAIVVEFPQLQGHRVESHEAVAWVATVPVRQWHSGYGDVDGDRTFMSTPRHHHPPPCSLPLRWGHEITVAYARTISPERGTPSGVALLGL